MYASNPTFVGAFFKHKRSCDLSKRNGDKEAPRVLKEEGGLSCVVEGEGDEKMK